MVPSGLSTGMRGAAQSENCTGSMMSALCSVSSSEVTLSRSAYGQVGHKKNLRAGVVFDMYFDSGALQSAHFRLEQFCLLIQHVPQCSVANVAHSIHLFPVQCDLQ